MVQFYDLLVEFDTILLNIYILMYSTTALMSTCDIYQNIKILPFKFGDEYLS